MTLESKNGRGGLDLDRRVILFVDDEEKILCSFKRLLNHLNGQYRVFYFNNANDALIKMETMSVDIVFSDVRMPGIDGIEFFKVVKDRYPGTIRVLLTGHSDQEKFNIGTKLCHFYLWKPISIGSLQTIIGSSQKINKWSPSLSHIYR